MKKLIILLTLGLFSLSFAQYGDYSPDYDNYYYGDIYDYPEEYYYEYPSDYYPDDYYQSNYRDYHKSIVGINWQQLFVDLHLTRGQINAILVLNRRFPNFHAWNRFYRVNPTRWYYDRFYSLRRILTPHQYIIFQNRFYGGVAPLVYFVNYHVTYYVPHYHVRPRYRHVDIHVYHRAPWRVRMVDGHRRVYRGRANSSHQRPRYNDRYQHRNINPGGRRDQDYYEQMRRRNRGQETKRRNYSQNREYRKQQRYERNENTHLNRNAERRSTRRASESGRR